jgi:hypothetical protein
MRLKAFIASLIAVLVFVSASASAKAAPPFGPVVTPAPNCGTQPWWPKTGVVRTNQQSIELSFQVNQAQISVLRCMGAFLEVNFLFRGVAVPGNQFTLASNLPGAQRDVPFAPWAFQPGVTLVPTQSLTAAPYYVRIGWTGANTSLPVFTADWIASHWAGGNVVETNACASGRAQGNLAWCVFPTARRQLLGGYVPLDGSVYPLG